jgi:uncharacterized repeat protein (TIGR01451 family)
MYKMVIMRTPALALLAVCAATAASGQATLNGLVIKAVAEVEIRSIQDGRETVKLAPANRVVPGDQVIYTLEIRNTGAAAVHAPTVTHPIPAHMAYVADSATGPGAEMSYSVDGGHTFDRPENLQAVDAEGHLGEAKAQDYTHIRWKFKNTLKSNSVAFARFRAIVK